MFAQMASTTLENIQKLLGKKFIDIALGIVVLAILTSVCFYLGFLRSLGIYMSDLNISIFELLDIEIVVTIGIIYSIVYGRSLFVAEKQHSATHPSPSTQYRVWSTIVVSVLFLLMIFSIYQGPYESDVVFSYLVSNLSLFFFPSVMTGFLMWCILSFNKSSAIELALIFCSVSIVSYTAGMYRAEDLILNGARNEHSVELANGKKMDVFLIKRFGSGDLVFYKNEPTFISSNSDRIVRFKKLSKITEISTGTQSAE